MLHTRFFNMSAACGKTPLERTARLNSLKNADIGLLSMDISNESSQVLTNGTLSLSRTPLEGRVSMKRSVQFSREHDAGVEKSAEVVVAEEEVEDNMSPLSSPDAGNEDGPSSLFQARLVMHSKVVQNLTHVME